MVFKLWSEVTLICKIVEHPPTNPFHDSQKKYQVHGGRPVIRFYKSLSRHVQKLKPNIFNEKMIKDVKIIYKNFHDLNFLDLDVMKCPNHHDNQSEKLMMPEFCFDF